MSQSTGAAVHRLACSISPYSQNSSNMTAQITKSATLDIHNCLRLRTSKHLKYPTHTHTKVPKCLNKSRAQIGEKTKSLHMLCYFPFKGPPIVDLGTTWAQSQGSAGTLGKGKGRLYLGMEPHCSAKRLDTVTSLQCLLKVSFQFPTGTPPQNAISPKNPSWFPEIRSNADRKVAPGLFLSLVLHWVSGHLHMCRGF